MGGTGLLCAPHRRREGLYHSHMVEWAASRPVRRGLVLCHHLWFGPSTLFCGAGWTSSSRSTVSTWCTAPARAASAATGAPWRSAAAAGVVIVPKPATPALATNSLPNTQAGGCGVARAWYCQHKTQPVNTAEGSPGPAWVTPAANGSGRVGAIGHTAETEGRAS